MLYFIIAILLVSMFPFFVILGLYLKKKQDTKFFYKKLDDIQNNSPFRQNNNVIPKNDHRFLSKNSNEKEGLVEEENGSKLKNNKIVGLAEPQGFWSKFIMNQKIGFLFARINSQDKSGGFWTNLINAQDISHDKDRGRRR